MRKFLAALAAALIATSVYATGITWAWDSYPTATGATALDSGRTNVGLTSTITCVVKNPDAAARNVTVTFYGEDGGGSGAAIVTQTISCVAGGCTIAIGAGMTAVGTAVSAVSAGPVKWMEFQLAGGTTAGARMTCYGRE